MSPIPYANVNFTRIKWNIFLNLISNEPCLIQKSIPFYDKTKSKNISEYGLNWKIIHCVREASNGFVDGK